MVDIPADKAFLYRILRRALIYDRIRRKHIIEGTLEDKEYLSNMNLHNKKENMS
jgi:hypothetical protein